MPVKRFLSFLALVLWAGLVQAQTFKAQVFYARAIDSSGILGGYYSQTWSYPNNIVPGSVSQCVSSPFDAVMSLFSGYRFINIDAQGGWSAQFFSSGSNSNMANMGIYFQCDSSSGSSSSSSSSVDPAVVAALQTSVASLQSAVATRDQTITNMQGNVQTLLTASAEPFDIDFAWQLFTFFYGGALSLWVFSKGIGKVLTALRFRH